ncbi:hypothetical protein DFH11DRAFT_1723856 [Phellopilus nigrolimitatus]|nr:hypothetical protein DFH11DRAFT_1723856 [Phellopilus nigrolimitatus]
MASVENSALGASAGPARVFVKSSSSAPVSSGHLSDGGRSLTRRSRVRRQSSCRDSSSSDLFSTSDDISSGQLFVKIPPSDMHAGSSPRSAGIPDSGAPPLPQRSPRRLQPPPNLNVVQADPETPWTTRPRTLSNGATTSHPVLDEGQGMETRSENGQFRRGQRPRVLSVPKRAFRNGSLSDSSEQPSPLTPSAFHDIPPMPVFARNRRFRHQPCDSGVTQQSTTSSSLYPKSTSTDDSYSSPPSLPSNDMDDRLIVAVDPDDNPHVHELSEMDADDVSYRLRLLMQNNYYLPPAHSKPFSEYSSSTAKKSPLKSPSPTFLDIFKVGKKKSSSPVQKAAKSPTAPILRTTSDSSTLSGLIRSPQTRSGQQDSHTTTMAPQSRQEAKKGRVVVVRERMEDIDTIAKQVEQDLKIREAERRRNVSESSPSEGLSDNLVDPTDSVDLPPVTANGFFGPQASMLNGMGVEASLGAAMMADRLPPSSPGIWSIDTEDEAWRKALLHAAVNHSLNNSPAATPARSRSDSSPFLSLDDSTSPSLPSPLAYTPFARSPTTSAPFACPIIAEGSEGALIGEELNMKDSSPFENSENLELGRRILTRALDGENIGDSAAPPSLAHGILDKPVLEASPQASDSKEQDQTSSVTMEANYELVRAETPTLLTTPLLPAPRRPLATPVHQPVEAQIDHGGEGPFVDETDHSQVAQDIPLRLSDEYETHVGLSGAFGELAPPGSQYYPATLSAVKEQFAGSVSASESTTSGSHYSDDEESTFHTPREHTLASTFAASRPSLSASLPRASSEYSQPSASPTTSTFRDAFDHSPYLGTSPTQSVANTLGGGESRASSRTSEHDDLRYAPISPPPRVSSSLAHIVLHPPPRAQSANAALHARAQVGSISEHVPAFDADDGERRVSTGGVYSSMPLDTLMVQGLRDPSMRSNSYPASPISFFDAVEMQSREEEEEEEEEEDEETCTEGEDDSDDESVAEERGYHNEPAETAIADSRSSSVHNVARDRGQNWDTFPPQLRNASSPQLVSGLSQSHVESSVALGYDVLDPRSAILNVPLHARSPRAGFWSRKQGKRHEILPNPPRVSESTVDRMKHEASVPPRGGAKRPQTASSRVEQRPWTGGNQVQGPSVQAWRDEQNRQDQSMSRLDGMLIEHMEREKEVLRRITTTLSKSSS